jgi:hypothetical protein
VCGQLVPLGHYFWVISEHQNDWRQNNKILMFPESSDLLEGPAATPLIGRAN